DDIAQADVGFGHADGGNVFAKGAGSGEQGMAVIHAEPVGIVVVGVMQNGLVRSAVHLRVTMLVTVDAMRAYAEYPGSRQLVYGAERTGSGVWFYPAGKDGLGGA